MQDRSPKIQNTQKSPERPLKTSSKSKIKRKQSFLRREHNMSLSQSGLFIRPHLQNLSISTDDVVKNQKLFKMMGQYLPKDVESIQRSIVNHVQYTLARTRMDFKANHCYQAVAHSVRDRLIEQFNDTHRNFSNKAPKYVYYLSLEFLIGRCLQNAVVNLDMEVEYREALRDFGYRWQKIQDKEIDPALGNGGLGRLAACFLDSMATLNYPAWGYGIRYDYGIFRQVINNGYQVEVPDYWLSEGNPWEIERLDVQYKIKFYGRTRKVVDLKGNEKIHWEDYESVIARAYDTPIPGYATVNTIGLRLWKSMPANQFDFNKFNSGDYFQAIKQKQKAQYITSVLYPNDNTDLGKQLRLKQQYLLVSASIQDIIRRDKKRAKSHCESYNWQDFPQNAAIQLNDTHPSLAIVELLRILIDDQGLNQQLAWQIVYQTFSYTNHTVLPQALEKWGVDILGRLLPRHLELIFLINFFWLNRVSKKYPDNWQKLQNLSIIQQSTPKRIRMANLCIVGSHTVNGVAYLHTQLLKTTLFKDFYEFNPNKYLNMTNGVTTRRWILCANPLLAELYNQKLSDVWVMNMEKLRELEKYCEDLQFQSKWRAIKMENKRRLAALIKRECNVQVNLQSMFDVHVKRIHEYKRQFMNILYVIWRYLWIKSMTPEQRINVIPRTVIYSGKAAPGYDTAKKIIKLINEVSYVVNSDDLTNNYLKVVFIPNYCVSNAEIIVPATEISQHISTAGTEASGTSNMKFVMNGGLILGTMDGANVQIFQEVSAENIFIFGAKVQEVASLKQKMETSPPQNYIPEPLKPVLQAIREGKFGDRQTLISLIQTITNNNDHYLVCADFCAYMDMQTKVDETYRNPKQWTKMSILNAIRTGKFSSDRTIKEYAQKIWKISPCQVFNNERNIEYQEEITQCK